MFRLLPLFKANHETDSYLLCLKCEVVHAWRHFVVLFFCRSSLYNYFVTIFFPTSIFYYYFRRGWIFELLSLNISIFVRWKNTMNLIETLTIRRRQSEKRKWTHKKDNPRTSKLRFKFSRRTMAAVFLLFRSLGFSWHFGKRLSDPFGERKWFIEHRAWEDRAFFARGCSHFENLRPKLNINYGILFSETYSVFPLRITIQKHVK